ncbi:hypothetical protein IJG04_01250 [Candidatus Saccharibacteria bacterium]|nr:hypothetical protein [Candidatus Saccharibacteria bacterium]
MGGDNAKNTTNNAKDNGAKKGLNFNFKFDLSDLKEKFSFTRSSVMSQEINLVPDVKNDMIKALKLRNFIFFVCIVVSIASVAVTAVFGSIAGAQQAAVDGKKSTLDTLSDKVTSYSDLSNFITIKDQLGNLSLISERKQLLSRSFGVLAALLPTGADGIDVSELSINLSGDNPTFSFDAQAHAESEPYINYNVLDAFKKSMPYMRYDYGTYVDRYGEDIPAYCIIESGDDGAMFKENGDYYALWLINGEGCNPSEPEEDAELEEELEEGVEEEIADAEDEANNAEGEATEEKTENNQDKEALEVIGLGYTPEKYNGQTVVRIWRTPQYDTWYKAKYMDLDGNISNIEHFKSECYTYSGTKDDDGTITWDSKNDSCKLVEVEEDGSGGIQITDSSNGRDGSGRLVLRFSAVITLNSEVFSFKNTHMLAIGPSGKRNVTDSYRQIQDMFEQRAADCEDGDTMCNSDTGGN